MSLFIMTDPQPPLTWPYVPWHSSVEEIAGRNFRIITGEAWGPKDFFLGVGYHTHNLKTTAVIGSAISLAKSCITNLRFLRNPRLGLHHIKLDLVSSSYFAQRTVHNNMLKRRPIALHNLSRTIPPIDEDQKVALLNAPFKGTTL